MSPRVAARRGAGARPPVAARFPAPFRRRAASTRVIALDSDGTLTDRGMGWDDAGREFRRFDVRDGLAMQWAMRAGLHVVVVSARATRAVDHRMGDLGVPVYQGAEDKVAVLREFCRMHRASHEQVAFLGDDLPDLPALRWSGLPLAVADAHPLVRRVAAWSTPSPGGHGGVREAIEALLDATGHWDRVLARYGESR